MVISAVFMLLTYQKPEALHLRSVLTAVVTPLQLVVNAPTRFYDHLQTSFVSQEALAEENQQLKAQQVLLQLRMQKLLSLERENKQLRALLSSSNVLHNHRVTVAQLISVASNPSRKEIIVDQGSQKNIYKGQPVLDAYGVMGQVIDVNAITSRVLLITDRMSAIPIENNRTGSRAIAEGTGYSGMLRLVHVPKTEDIKVNDLLVTSGLGNVYPPGYPVGKIVHVTRDPGDQFASVLIEPTAHMNSSRLMLLLWPGDDVKT